MPFTFFAHQTVVVPLKWWQPRWFDGTALCIGSMAPDLYYALDGTRYMVDAHSLLGQFTLCLPMTIILTVVFRRLIAGPLGANLPGSLGRWLETLGAARRPFFMTVWSALIGSFSHVFLDGFTHMDGWAVQRFPALRDAVVLDWPLPRLLQYVGHTFGTLLGVAMLGWAIRRDKGSAEVGKEISGWFFLPLVIGVALALLVVWWTAPRGGVGALIIRAAWVMLLALCFSALFAKRRYPT